MSVRVRDVMTSNPSTVTPDTMLTEVAEEIIEQRYSGVPVVGDTGELVGVVEVEDLLPRSTQVPFTDVPVLEFQGEWIEEDTLERYSRDLQGLTVDRVMRTDLLKVSPDTRLAEVLASLIEGVHRRVLVVDENNRLVGVVTRTDLLRVFSRWP